MNFTTKLLCSLCLLTLFSCNQEESGWEQHFVTPVAEGKLDIFSNFVDQDIDGDTLALVWNSELFSISADTILAIPDTNYDNNLYTPVGGGAPKQPGDTLFEASTEMKYKFDDLQLSSLNLKNGSGDLVITNTTEEDLEIIYELPQALKNGVPFKMTHILPAGSLSAPITISIPFDLSGYNFNLRGENYDTYNKLVVKYTIVLATHSNPLTIIAGTYININSAFVDWKASSVMGNFSNLNFDLSNEVISDDALNQFSADSLNIESAAIKLNIENGFGLDIGFVFNDISGTNENGNEVLLEGLWKSQNLLIPRATRTGNSVVNQNKEIIINSNNSNIQDWISNLPKSISLDANVSSNPNGNNSNNTDFIIEENGLKVNANLEIPLAFYAQNFSLIDTTEFNADSIDLENIISGNVNAYIQNYYPFDMSLNINLLDSNKNLISTLNDELLEIDAGYNYSAEESLVKIPFNSNTIEKLNQTQYLELIFGVSTNEQLVYVQPDTPMDVIITMDFIHKSKF